MIALKDKCYKCEKAPFCYFTDNNGLAHKRECEEQNGSHYSELPPEKIDIVLNKYFQNLIQTHSIATGAVSIIQTSNNKLNIMLQTLGQQ